MAIKEDATERPARGAPPRGCRGCLPRLLTLAAFVLVILLAAGYFVVRSEGGRAFIKDHIEKALGTDVEIRTTRIGWPYAVVIEGLSSMGFTDGAPGFRAREVRFGIGFDLRWTVRVYRGELVLMDNEKTGWRPEAFNRLGDLPVRNVGDISRLTEGLRNRVDLHVRDASVRWLDAGGKEAAAASGVDLDVIPVRLPGRDMYDYELRAYSVLYPDGSRTRAVTCEWLAGESADDIQIDLDPPQEADKGGGFWKPAPSTPREKGTP